MKNPYRRVALLACVASLSGCMTDQQYLAQNQAARSDCARVTE